MLINQDTKCPAGHQGSVIYHPNVAGSQPFLTCAICGQLIDVQANQVVGFAATSGLTVHPQPSTWRQVIDNNNEILSEALQEAYDKMKANRDMFKGVNPPSHYYENGYREGVDAAMRIVGDMIDARKNS